MKTVATVMALAAAAKAMPAGCCFHLTAFGGPGGPVGQISDGQNRIGQMGLPSGQYCISDGGKMATSCREFLADVSRSHRRPWPRLHPDATDHAVAMRRRRSAEQDLLRELQWHSGVQWRQYILELSNRRPWRLEHLFTASQRRATLCSDLAAYRRLQQWLSISVSDSIPGVFVHEADHLISNAIHLLGEDCHPDEDRVLLQLDHDFQLVDHDLQLVDQASQAVLHIVDRHLHDDVLHYHDPDGEPELPCHAQRQLGVSLIRRRQFPHLIVPVDNKYADIAHGTTLNGTAGSRPGESLSSIFNFDIPAADAGKICNLQFMFPTQSMLETSSYQFVGNGTLEFATLAAPATKDTTYNNAPAVTTKLGNFHMAPGNSYDIARFDCPAGETVAFRMYAAGDVYLNYFQDFNPCPIGLYITVE